MSMTHSPRAMRGMTLIELGVVLLILVALAGLALPYVGGIIGNSSCELTEATLQNVRSAIIGSPTSPGFVGDMNRMPYNLSELLSCTSCTQYNASANHGWRGPYLSNNYTPKSSSPVGAMPVIVTGMPIITDQFRTSTTYSGASGSPIQLVIKYNGGANCNYFLLSNGPNGITDTPISTTAIPIIISCPNISSATMTNLHNSNTPYLNATALPISLNRNDDQLLFIESVDPGTNATCNNN